MASFAARALHSIAAVHQPGPAVRVSRAIGAIASALAPRCKAFEMTVVGVDDRLSEAPHVDHMFPPERLTAALAGQWSLQCAAVLENDTS